MWALVRKPGVSSIVPLHWFVASRIMSTKGLLASPERLLDILDRQGSWTEDEYLSLTDDTTRLVEFTDGFLELLPTPTDYHQAIVQFLLYALDGFLKPLGGKVRIAPLRLRIGKGKFREPDLLLLRSASDRRRQNRFWTGADLVV